MTAVALVLAVVMVVVERQGWLIHAGSDRARYEGRWHRVAAVVDGDTLDLAVRDRARPTTRVRLWGVDTPELARGGAPAEPYAQAAADRAQELAFDRRVLITLQPHRPRDRYGRLLAYVGLEDGSVLNEVLISEGLAEADDRWSHRDLNRYALLEEQARVSGRGRWGE